MKNGLKLSFEQKVNTLFFTTLILLIICVGVLAAAIFYLDWNIGEFGKGYQLCCYEMSWFSFNFSFSEKFIYIVFAYTVTVMLVGICFWFRLTTKGCLPVSIIIFCVLILILAAIQIFLVIYHGIEIGNFVAHWPDHAQTYKFPVGYWALVAALCVNILALITQGSCSAILVKNKGLFESFKFTQNE